MKEFKNKSVVVTGAGQGIGREIALECARRGSKLVLNDIDKEALNTTTEDCKAIGAEVIAAEADASLYGTAEKLVKTAVDNYGTVDLMVNNAGIYIIGTLWDMPARDLQWMVETNVLGVLYGMKAVLPVMKKNNSGHILNIASLAGFVAVPRLSGYHATKHAVVGASESAYMDIQAAKLDIGMTIFCPGYVQTNLHNSYDHRPERFKSDDPYYESEVFKKYLSSLERHITTGVKMEEVIPQVFKAVEDNQFFLLTDIPSDAMIAKRHSNILSRTNPDINNMA